ncbi:substrate-binding domain-containing protein [Treponema sp.]|uniref:substrate-binding domain-containing protein n=1 Tax=Treponema sp. TaxID=166 RepID=UPI00388E8BDD
MALKLSQRKQFLAERKNEGRRVTIGFTGIADLRHFIGLEYIKGMMKAAADYDINFINMGGAVRYSLFDDINFLSHYKKNFKFMKAPLLDGIVTWAASLSEFMEQGAIKELFASLQPLPMVDIGHMDIPGATMLKIDASSSIRAIMNHLIEVHHYKKFAFVGTDISEPQNRRLLHFEHELKMHGIPLIEGAQVMFSKKMEAKYIDEAFNTLADRFDLKGKKDIEAIVTASDIIAAEGIEQLSRRGISVPDDVAVIGFNNWYESITSRSPLTTIDLVYFKRGYAAVELLIDMILQPEQKIETMYFPTDLIVRQSCGCLENSVSCSKLNAASFSNAAGHGIEAAPVTEARLQNPPPESEESEDELRTRLIASLRSVFPFENDESISKMLDSFFSDVYDSNEESRMVIWFQNVMQNVRKSREFDSDVFQNAVSSLRSLLLPALKTESPSVILAVENIFHQMRSLVSVFQKYEAIADRENPYRINNISGQAINFLSAQNMEQVFEVLRYQLGELDIPGAMVALSDTMSYSFPVPSLELIIPEPSEELKTFMHKPLGEPQLFPKELFDKNRRYSVMLEVLHHADQYFGYAFFEMKTPNLATYDVVRMLLSNAVYSIYKKEGKVKYSSYELEQTQIENIIKPEPSEKKESNVRQRLKVEKLTAYLTEHISEMTNIDKIAGHFMVSRSYLSKKCKELTGLSVQQLHEKLKVEQAKNMLKMENFELSEIARELGFKNQNYFSNVFKKNTGMSPKNWLKSNS